MKKTIWRKNLFRLRGFVVGGGDGAEGRHVSGSLPLHCCRVQKLDGKMVSWLD